MIIELISQIKKRPAMYLGKRSIHCLNSFLTGWLIAKSDESCHKVMGDFQKWIQAKYNIITTHSWAGIIDFYSQDEFDALYSFFELFDEFLKEN